MLRQNARQGVRNLYATGRTWPRATLPRMAKDKMYVVNLDFDGGSRGEYIVADPRLVEDWLEAGFVSEVDESGMRIITGPRGGQRTDPGASPPGDLANVRTVTADEDE